MSGRANVFWMVFSLLFCCVDVFYEPSRMSLFLGGFMLGMAVNYGGNAYLRHSEGRW